MQCHGTPFIEKTNITSCRMHNILQLINDRKRNSTSNIKTVLTLPEYSYNDDPLEKNRDNFSLLNFGSCAKSHSVIISIEKLDIFKLLQDA